MQALIQPKTNVLQALALLLQGPAALTGGFLKSGIGNIGRRHNLEMCALKAQSRI
jgi:hypothetical protein